MQDESHGEKAKEGNGEKARTRQLRDENEEALG
jgi:hypothetical protein